MGIPSLTVDITAFYPIEFAKNWETVAQQMGSRLLGSVTHAGDLKGRSRSWNMLKPRAMKKVTTRKGDTPDGDSDGDKYWAYRSKYEDVIIFDEDDEALLGDIVLPTSDEVKGQAEAYNRTVDDTIIEAATATRMTGENGTVPDAFPAAQDVAVDYVDQGATANSGLTFAKIRRTAQLMNSAEVPDGDRFFVHTGKQLDNLLAMTQTTSRDYTDLQSLKDGKIEWFMGFRWIRSERLTLNVATDVRSCFAFHKTAIKFVEGKKNVHIDLRPDKRHATQIRTVARCGAVRTENVKVVRVYCDESS